MKNRKRKRNQKKAENETKKKSTLPNPLKVKAPVKPAPEPLKTPQKAQCECGQMVSLAVANPTNQFEEKDRLAHLTSKRHQKYTKDMASKALAEQNKTKAEKKNITPATAPLASVAPSVAPSVATVPSHAFEAAIADPPLESSHGGDNNSPQVSDQDQDKKNATSKKAAKKKKDKKNRRNQARRNQAWSYRRY